MQSLPYIQTNSAFSFDSSAYQKEILRQTKQQETVVFSTVIAPKTAHNENTNALFDCTSSDGEIIVSADNFGSINIVLFRIQNEENEDKSIENTRKKQKIVKEDTKIILRAHYSSIFSLCFLKSGQILIRYIH